MSLLKYLTPDAKKYYENFLKTIFTEENKNKNEVKETTNKGKGSSSVKTTKNCNAKKKI